MRLLGDFSGGYKLVSVSDEKKLIIDTVIPYSNKVSFEMPQFLPAENIIGVAFAEKADSLVVCSDQRQCLVLNYGMETLTSRLFKTVENIDYVFFVSPTILLAIVNYSTNSLGLYAIEELSYINSKKNIREVEGLSSRIIKACSGFRVPNYERDECRCLKGYFEDESG
jgi:hypothetical protein